MPELAQHVIVTLVAIWAAYLVITRVVSMVSPGKPGGGTCDSCPTGQRRGAEAEVAGAVKPLTLVTQRPPADRERSRS
jgi:hypothetical protein